MPSESMEMPQMNNNMVAQPQTTEQPKAEEPMSMSLRGGGLCEDCCCCCAGCCALETICCCLGAEEVADNL
ncbi:hypothetical protein INS49_007028 [Diaporthe citri]|uniref:Cysteine-rich transmembrane CYSTM domain-containing protein n=1 Tax=Diaporthe vaccinii TaxID=105482 RepID=A0ABR4F316_9PEZI|nr:uncharacterized protein INS49_007028 [Diaporthe citri]KAG6365417.1 hypothetical protein INS49_007028 [Diaporthe citri]KAI7787640.1 hypothetical protein LA080_015009 [Diaporthe eres]